MENKNQNRPFQEGDQNRNQVRRSFVLRFLPKERRNNGIQREKKDNVDEK